jgi:hypothetical protein
LIHDADRADDLSNTCEVVEIHLSQLVVVGQALRLPKQKKRQPMRSPYNFNWRSYSALSKWPFDSAMSPSSSSCQSSYPLIKEVTSDKGQGTSDG